MFKKTHKSESNMPKPPSYMQSNSLNQEVAENYSNQMLTSGDISGKLIIFFLNSVFLSN